MLNNLSVNPSNQEHPYKGRNGQNAHAYRGGTRFIVNSSVIMSEARQKALEKTKRKRLVLGRIVNRGIDGNWKIGRIVTHDPSPIPSQTESIYIKGASGSGKTWVAYSIAGQSFFAENRTWIILDTKGSYRGNYRPNVMFSDQIYEMGGVPMGIPYTQIDVISPLYYVAALTPDEIKRHLITDTYKVPLRLCSLPVMFELTKLNRNSRYAASFDQRFKNIMIETAGNPKLSDIMEMIDSIIDDPDMSRMRWIYVMMKKTIEEVSDLVIDDNSIWSSVGKAMERAAREGRARWIVFTLNTGQDSADSDLNLGIVSTILQEIKMFTSHYLLNKEKEGYGDFRVGVLIDELHTYVRNKNSSTRYAIHDLLHQWGRSNQVLRIFLTQRDEQLDKVFQDDIDKKNKSSGTYQCVIQCYTNPEPGYLSYINRVSHDPRNIDQPLFYPMVKSCPPLFEVESNEINNHAWAIKMGKVLKEKEEFY